MVRGAVMMPGSQDFPTALEAARLPTLGRVAAAGRVGSTDFGGADEGASAEAALLSVLGYDARDATVPVPVMEALGAGETLKASDWVLGLNLVSLDETGETVIAEGVRGLAEAELEALLRDLVDYWKANVPGADALRVRTGRRWMHLLMDSSGRSYDRAMTAAPAELIGERWKRMPAAGDGSEFLNNLSRSSSKVLATHEVNTARREQGLRGAELAWVWGPGRLPRIVPFKERHGVKGAVIADDGSLVGAAISAGMQRVHAVPGRVGVHQGKVRAVEHALRRADVALCIIEDIARLPWDDLAMRVKALETLDTELLAPLVSSLENTYSNAESGGEGWRMMVLADGVRHGVAAPSYRDVPFLVAGSWIVSTVRRSFTEKEAWASDLQVDRGHTLMEYFLRSGLPRSRTR